MKFDNETMAARVDKIHLGDQFVDAFGEVHTATSDWDHPGMVVTPRKKDFAWLLDVAPENKRTEYLCPTNGIKFRWRKGQLERRTEQDTFWQACGISDSMLTATFEDAPPAEGSPKWFAALPEGTCCWSGDDRTCYARRVGPKGYEWILVRNGRVTSAEAQTELTTWSLCLHNGERAEPVVGSQFWADVMQRLGVEVHHETMAKGYRVVSGHYVLRNGSRAKVVPGWFTNAKYATGWSLWTDTVADDARKALAEIDEHRKAVAEIVERMKGENKP